MIIIDGQPVHPAVAAALKLLDTGFYTATGQHLRVTSGYRSKAAQAKLFLARYRAQWAGRGAYNDVRWWKGKRYVRHSGAGTVAVPGTSLHESFRALDIRDTGKDSGVTTAGTVRSNWIKKNAHLYGFNPRGLTFGEPWHIEYTGSLTQTSGDVTPTETEDLMPMKIIAPYGMPDRAVIGGGLAYAFPNEGEFKHFLNLNGLGTPDTVKVTIVGDAKMSKAQRRAVFKTLVKIYT